MKRSIFEVIAAAAFLSAIVSCGGNAAKSAETEVEEERVTKVVVSEAVYANVPKEESYSSTVQAYVVNNVVPQSGGRIKKINVEIGDFVKEGQVLAEMDRVSLEQAHLKLVNDSTELSRLKELYREGGISQSDFEAVQLAYNVSKASFDNLLENTILRSPVNGVITARNYDRGDMYSMASPIYVVQQITPVKILIGVSEADYTKVSKGDKVSINVDAIPGKTFVGRVNRIYPTMDAATHTFTIEVVVPNQDRVLRPGMYAKVTVTFEVNRSIVVPDSAVMKLQGSGQRAVYVLQEDGTVKYTVVTPGKHFDKNYEILEGLSEGDKVVIKGHSALKNGSKVEI